MNKKSLLLFKNAFKQAFRNKIQLVGLVVLVLLSSTIFSLMQTSLARVSDEYTTLVSKSNLHDFVIDLSNTANVTSKSVSDSKIELEDGTINKIANMDNNQFQWDRVEARTIQLDNDGKSRILKVVTDNANARIDKLVISEGTNIGVKNGDIEKQTVINKEFAQNNNLTIGDTIRVQKDELGTSLKVTGYDLSNPAYKKYAWLKIVGFGTSADFTTPIIDRTTPIPNKTREGILYVDPSNFGLSAVKNTTDSNFQWSTDGKENITVSSNNDKEVYFVGKSLINHKNNLSLISKSLRQTYVNTIDSDAKLVYALGDNSYQFANRTNTLVNAIAGFKSLLVALLLIVLIITGITVVLITYKNIDNSKTQIGILKSLGYSNIKILITSLAYPMAAAIIGTILVFLPASGLQLIVVHSFANYFNLNFGSFKFNGLGFLYCLILTFGFLSIIAWIISALTVIKKPIVLIKNESPATNSRFSRMIKTSNINRSFLTRFRLSLFTSSIGKMAAASLTMFLGTILMTAAIIGPKIMSDNKIVTYTGMNYQSTVEYNMPTYNSPFTFYKTYNSNLTPWKYTTINGTDPTTGTPTSYNRPDRTVSSVYNNSEFAKELLANNINSEAYAPMSLNLDPQQAIVTDVGMSSLTFLHGKMLTKSFLNGLDESIFNSPLFTGTLIAPNAWPTVVPIYTLLGQYEPPNPKEFYSSDNYNKLRSFYQTYRSTVDMNIAANITTTCEISANPADFDVNKFKTFASTNLQPYQLDPTTVGGGDTFIEDINHFSFNTSDKKYPFHLQNEDQLLNNMALSLSNPEMNSWINKVSIWFGAMFYGRVGQTIVQGAYSRSPYFIRQNIASAYKNPDQPFNVSFNVIPFNQDNDELGTYFTGLPTDKNFNGNKYPIKVYGLQNEQQLEKASMMQLYDQNGNVLNSLLEKDSGSDTTSIVINQTIAKQLSLTIDSEFTMSTNGNIMEYKGSDNQFHPFDPNATDFTNNTDGSSGINNVTMVNQNTGFTDCKDLKTKAYFNLGSDATAMLKDVANNKVVNAYDKDSTKYKVVGVYNGYGQPNAYISKHNADKLLNYNNLTSRDSKGNYHDTRSMLFKLFRQEWQNDVDKKIDFSVLKTTDYNKFLTDPNVDSDLIKMFDHEYPIFNFKFSNSSTLPDITNSFSTSQLYGDYSAIGLNGGGDGTTLYQGYGAGSASNITPLYVHHQLLNQITALVDAVLAFFIAFSLIISFFIILLTSNLVIYENRKTIATMKTLGYSDAKITNIVIGMYLPVIAAMFVFGFPVGWVIVRIIINYLAFHTTWVLPLFFAWWLPIAVAIIVLGIYATTFVIDWYAMKKINPIKTLNEID